jgi:hypothetical protein
MQSDKKQIIFSSFGPWCRCLRTEYLTFNAVFSIQKLKISYLPGVSSSLLSDFRAFYGASIKELSCAGFTWLQQQFMFKFTSDTDRDAVLKVEM